jgi:hypothetical protein
LILERFGEMSAVFDEMFTLELVQYEVVQYEVVKYAVVQYEVVEYVTLGDTTRAVHTVLQPGWVQFTKYYTYTGWGIRHGQGKWCYNAANGGWVQFTCPDSQRTYRCRLVVALALGAKMKKTNLQVSLWCCSLRQKLSLWALARAV